MRALLLPLFICLSVSIQFSVAVGPERARCFYEHLDYQAKFNVEVTPMEVSKYEFFIQSTESGEIIFSKMSERLEPIVVSKFSPQANYYGFCIRNLMATPMSTVFKLESGIELMELSLLPNHSDNEYLNTEIGFLQKQKEDLFRILQNLEGSKQYTETYKYDGHQCHMVSSYWTCGHSCCEPRILQANQIYSQAKEVDLIICLIYPNSSSFLSILIIPFISPQTCINIQYLTLSSSVPDYPVLVLDTVEEERREVFQNLPRPKPKNGLLLTLYALREIENRKQLPDISSIFNLSSWSITKKGHLVEMHKKIFDRDLHVVFSSKKYPPKILKAENQQDASQQNKSTNISEEEPQVQLFHEFRLYIKQPKSSTYLIVQFKVSQEGLSPLSIDFTKNLEQSKHGKEEGVWNELDDLSQSTLHFLKRILVGLEIGDEFGWRLMEYSKYSLKDDYKEWLQNLIEFVRE